MTTEQSDEIGEHVQGRGRDGQGRSLMEKVTCSCGWEMRSDQAYFAEWRRAKWMDHAIEVLLREVADLRSQLAVIGRTETS